MMAIVFMHCGKMEEKVIDEVKVNPFSNILSVMGVQSYDPLVVTALEEYSRSMN